MKWKLTLAPAAVLSVLAALALTLVAADWLWSLEGIRDLQVLGSRLKLPMQIATFLGDQSFYLLAMPLVYWCIHKGAGAELGILLTLSSFTNTALKGLIKHSRPFWEDAALRLSDATSFSTPSGHAQSSAALFGNLARLVAGKHRGRVWASLLGALIVLVGLSRVYLGVHFPGDVLWGAAAGLGLLALYAWLKPILLPRLRRLSIGLHLALASAASAASAAVAMLLLTAPVGPPIGPGEVSGKLWAEAWATAREDAGTVAGMALGLWVGLVLESRYVRFSVAGRWWQRVLRYLVGAGGLAVMWTVLDCLSPQEPAALGLALRLLQSALVILWGIAVWPWLFVRIGLAAREG